MKDQKNLQVGDVAVGVFLGNVVTALISYIFVSLCL